MADQESVTVQVAGTGAQSATVLETQQSPNSSSQVTSSVTQIQIGCIVECFGTTTTDPSTAAFIQQFLSDLNSLQPTCGSSTLQPVSATEQSIIDLVACQVQDAQTIAAQTQVASQSATTVQVSDPTPVPQPPAPSSVAQAQQGTWQLQIGCVFHCVDTQQVQQAQQSITIIQVQTGAPGSGPGVVDATDQIIWQVQIGCVAWCYDATQVQLVTGQSTVIVDQSPAPASPPPPVPDPPPPTSPAAPSTGQPPPAQPTEPTAGQATVTASPSSPVEGPPERTTPRARPVRLLRMVSSAGGSGSRLSALVATVARVRESAATVVPPSTRGTSTVGTHALVAAVAYPSSARSRHLAARPHLDRPVRVAEAVAADPRRSASLPVVALLLVAAAALILLAAVWTHAAARPGR